MWQEIIVFAMTAGAIWYLIRMFYRTGAEKTSGCGCGGCSTCPADFNIDLSKAGK